LVIEGVRSANGVKGNFGKQPLKPLVAKPAGRAFDGVCGDAVGCGALWDATRFGCSVDAGFVERYSESGSKIAAEFKVSIGLCTAQTVMQVRDMKH
jgi:hypothetical protein